MWRPSVDRSGALDSGGLAHEHCGKRRVAPGLCGTCRPFRRIGQQSDAREGTTTWPEHGGSRSGSSTASPRATGGRLEARHAEDSGVLDAAPRVPAKKDLRQPWWKIHDQGSTGSCVGWARADGVLRWHFVKAAGSPRRADLAPVPVDGREGDRRFKPADDVHRGRGDEREGALDVPASSVRFATPCSRSRPAQAYAGRRQDLLRDRRPAQDQPVLQPREDLENWRLWLATKGPILTRLDVDSTWDGATETRASSTSTSPRRREAGTRSRSSATPARRSSCATAGAPAWGDKGFGTPHRLRAGRLHRGVRSRAVGSTGRAEP